MQIRVCFVRAMIVTPASLLVMMLAASAAAGPRMYMGSLVIHAFGNDTSTGGSAPFTRASHIGIPLTGGCHTGPYHPKESLSFPVYSAWVTFTIPAYGGATNSVDTNGDTIPDVPSGCGAATREVGDPLTGAGPVNTAGATTTSRTPNDPRGFTLPQWGLRRTKSSASFARSGVHLWEVHLADLHNATGVFAKSGGDGAFAVTHPSPKARRSVVQRAGNNRFGGVMSLLGSYGSNRGDVYNAQTTAVVVQDWLFDDLGHGRHRHLEGDVAARAEQPDHPGLQHRAAGPPLPTASAREASREFRREVQLTVRTPDHHTALWMLVTP